MRRCCSRTTSSWTIGMTIARSRGGRWRRRSLRRIVRRRQDADIRAIEQRGDASLDAAANRFGMILGCVFSYREDFWAGELRRMGAWLGKFVYLMDAVMDYDEDLKSGSYNPLVAAGAVPGDVSEGLRSIAAQAAQSFERLPLEQDIRILRNVLYAGLCSIAGSSAMLPMMMAK